MSRYTEYVVWQSRNATWNIAEYHKTPNGSPNDNDWDEEWGYDYSYESFDWVKRGFRSEDDAKNSWKFANPGHGGDRYLWVNDKEKVEELDKIAAFHLNPSAAEAFWKAETQQKVQARRRKLKKQLADANYYENKRVVVRFGNNKEAIASGTGIFSTYVGKVASSSDNLLTVDGQELYNKNTKKLAPLLFSVTISN